MKSLIDTLVHELSRVTGKPEEYIRLQFGIDITEDKMYPVDEGEILDKTRDE